MNDTIVCDEQVGKQLVLIIDSLSMLRISFIILLVLLVPICLIAILGNGLIFTMILKTPNLQKPSYLLIASMTVIDFMQSLIYYPFLFVRIVWILQEDSNIICRTDRSFVMIGLFFVTCAVIA